MATRPVEIGPARIQAARNIERLRLLHGLSQQDLAERCTALGRPLTNIALSRTERARRRCDVDDLVTIASALGVSPIALFTASVAAPRG
ncbi:helix-turn-helix transcriptional regulator [Streptomyces sp. ISL-1]|uniref:helix-turn-helix domain-containing protein n=1 Tax=Streptomyces sp. ISL-1 TaxID=2817657 RepID=UPI001BE5E327|nr:helix-turn-helix transcriptional regulator [Streptomyces sp. ISL-1]MBT2393688.1 helix-turn-helix transcriptional regulator [Streptomyces sp. ISL-1]